MKGTGELKEFSVHWWAEIFLYVTVRTVISFIGIRLTNNIVHKLDMEFDKMIGDASKGGEVCNGN